MVVRVIGGKGDWWLGWWWVDWWWVRVIGG